MYYEFLAKGTQLAKLDLQHQPCLAITFPLTLPMVAKLFHRFQSPNDILNTYAKPTGTNKLKAME